MPKLQRGGLALAALDSVPWALSALAFMGGVGAAFERLPPAAALGAGALGAAGAAYLAPIALVARFGGRPELEAGPRREDLPALTLAAFLFFLAYVLLVAAAFHRGWAAAALLAAGGASAWAASGRWAAWLRAAEERAALALDDEGARGRLSDLLDPGGHRTAVTLLARGGGAGPKLHRVYRGDWDETLSDLEEMAGALSREISERRAAGAPPPGGI